MTDYDKLVAALRCKRDDCEGCDLAFFDKDEGWMCQYAAKDDDAADAIEELKDMPWVESVQVDKLRQRIDELEEKQTYCDAYGDKWMTSGKDVPTEAYKHGYADGWDEARAKMEVQDESVF
jgi:hypothetical protein